ncbi:MAG: TIGR00725 family protein [Bacteroidetes bacterium]|nr:TIGR00725 family protein [Bacteroidota bacterium]
MPLRVPGIIGPNAGNCPQQLYEFGVELGRKIATVAPAIVCGGMGGFMEAVCRGAKSNTQHNCLTIGILPGSDPQSGNRWLDIVIPSGLGLARNVLVVQSAHVVVAAGGGAGTLSEIAFALQTGKTVICVHGFGGFSEWMLRCFIVQVF